MVITARRNRLLSVSYSSLPSAWNISTNNITIT
ncbi:hypothetical protein LSH36_70g07024 [Paralvinella palmiformis]|uniref:Uncharacterized protein n=1 Tax=Paralvinella palmiformis TaxID=53620 RepID=A0AAD9K368_9ANNE|nr:hypothetical protein LSH36_70g07024 [Paralvinella palmiformis]